MEPDICHGLLNSSKSGCSGTSNTDVVSFSIPTINRFSPLTLISDGPISVTTLVDFTPSPSPGELVQDPDPIIEDPSFLEKSPTTPLEGKRKHTEVDGGRQHQDQKERQERIQLDPSQSTKSVH